MQAIILRDQAMLSFLFKIIRIVDAISEAFVSFILNVAKREDEVLQSFRSNKLRGLIYPNPTNYCIDVTCVGDERIETDVIYRIDGTKFTKGGLVSYPDWMRDEKSAENENPRNVYYLERFLGFRSL